MTDEELVAVLRWRGSALQEGAFPAAATRIEQLTAEYEEAMECNEQFFVDNEFLKKRVAALTAERDEMAMSCLSADGEAQRAWNAQKGAEAEAARLREALGKLECKCSSNCDWQRDDVCPSWIARAALKGETP